MSPANATQLAWAKVTAAFQATPLSNRPVYSHDGLARRRSEEGAFIKHGMRTRDKVAIFP